MNNNILISVGILQNIWEQHKQDTLDLLMPFLKRSIARTTKLGDIIDLDSITHDFRSEYGYDDIPMNVITVMLNRLSPSVVKKENGRYRFKKDLNQEVTDFERKKRINKEHQEKVIEALKAHLEENIPLEKFSDDTVTDYLYSFFVSNGLCMARDTDALIGIKRKDGKVEYEIARFVMNEYHNDTTVFSYLCDMVYGFFVSTALGIQQAATPTKTKMRGLSCYIDTRIIINALGLHLPMETKASAVEFFDMLKNSGVQLYCFQHNFNEIQNVLTAYKTSLSITRNKTPWNTLEAFDAQGYTASDVESYITRLSHRIENLGIEIKPTPSYEPSLYNKTAYIDSKGLEELLKAEMRYNTNSINTAAEADVNSAVAIMLLRNGNNAYELEKAGHIFVSSSSRYCSIVSRFLGIQELGCVPVAYSETDLSSLMWLRNYSTHKDYPKSKLIENAMSILEVPSQQFLTGLFDTIDRLQSQGDITADEATILRQDYYSKKEILSAAKGDSDAITEETLKAAKARLRDKYIGDENKQAELNYQKYIIQKEENNRAFKKASDSIREIGENEFSKWEKRLTKIANIGMIIILVIIVGCMIYGIVGTSSWALITAAVLLIVDVFAFIDLLKNKKKTIKKWINSIARRKADNVMDKKREEYEALLGSFDQRIS